MKNKRNFVSIFLVKEGIEDLAEIVKDYKNYNFKNDNYENSYKENIRYIKKEVDSLHWIFIKEYCSKPKTVFNNFYKDQLNELINSNVNQNYSIMSIYQIKINEKEKRTFIVHFGLSKLYNEDCIEERFGLKTILGIDGSMEKIREITALDVSNECKTTLQKFYKNKELNKFEIKYNTEILKEVKINFSLSSIQSLNEESDKNQIIQAKDFIKLKISYDYNDISVFLIAFYQEYKLEKYKKNSPWLDNIKEIKDKEILSSLWDELVKKIDENDKNVWISLPYYEDSMSISNVSYINKKNFDDSNEIEMEIYKKYKSGSIGILDLNKDKIFILDDDNNVINEYKIIELFYAEISFEQEVYILENKKWYLLNSDYKKEIDSFYENEMNEWHNKLIDNKWANEDIYNKKLSEQNNWLLMDKKFIHCRNNDKFELCDVLTKDKELINVKFYGNSAKLGHLFSQGRRSIQEIFDPKMLDSINDKISSEKFKIKENDRKDYSIIFAIICNRKQSGKPDIPFFAKSKMMLECKEIKDKGVEFYITSINNKYKKVN